MLVALGRLLLHVGQEAKDAVVEYLAVVRRHDQLRHRPAGHHQVVHVVCLDDGPSAAAARALRVLPREVVRL